MNKSTQENKNILNLAQEVFSYVDKDNSNTISVDELQTLINQIAMSLEIESPSNDEIQNLLVEFDENGDGELQLEEFQKLVQQLFTPNDDPNSPGQKYSKKASTYVENNDDDEEDVDKTIELVPIKEYKKPGFRDFINSVQKKKLSALDGSFIQMLIQQQQRQSRISCTLDEEVGKLVKEIDSMTQSKQSSTMMNSQLNKSQISTEERQQIDKQYMNNSQIVRTGSISSVYTSMEPRVSKKSVQSPTDSLGLEIPQQQVQKMSQSSNPKRHNKNSKSVKLGV